MWYLGYADRSGPTGFLRPALGQMVSEDAEGTRWRRPAAPIYRPPSSAWDGLLVSGPTVVRGPDGRDVAPIAHGDAQVGGYFHRVITTRVP